MSKKLPTVFPALNLTVDRESLRTAIEKAKAEVEHGYRQRCQYARRIRKARMQIIEEKEEFVKLISTQPNACYSEIAKQTQITPSTVRQWIKILMARSYASFLSTARGRPAAVVDRRAKNR